MASEFAFTRVPSTKVRVSIELENIVPADNNLLLFGRRAAPTPAVKEKTLIDTVADVSASLDGKFFNLPDDLGSVGFWIDIDDSGTTIPAGALALDRAIEITTILTNDDANTVATKIAAAIQAEAEWETAAAIANQITATAATAGTRADAADGDAGFTISVSVQGAPLILAGTGQTGVPTKVENFGNPDNALLELEGLFGVGSEISEMVVAAVKANLFSDLTPVVFPPITVIAMANGDTDLASALSPHLSLPMPFVAVPFPGTDVTNRNSLRDHLLAISGEDRGINGQFGSFGFMALEDDLATATPIGEAAATENLLFPWIRDLDTSKANKIHEVAAAISALSASNGIPFLPLNDIKVGGLNPPNLSADFHTPGDTGSVALGLESGLIPLQVSEDGTIRISRTVTSRRSEPSIADSAFFDMQDWQSLYFLRKNTFLRAQEPRFKRAKATDQKLLSLKSELLVIAKDLESLEILQKVDQFADQFTVTRPKTNRSAAVYQVPINVVAGFHNKGIDLIGTNQFDSFEL